MSSILKFHKSTIFPSSKNILFSQLKLQSSRCIPCKPNYEKILSKVKGLSKAVLVETPCEVKPRVSKSGDYKVPEYFSYHRHSYYEAHIELLPFRLQQPSAIANNKTKRSNNKAYRK